ncbi:hypothetical protein LCGC14_3007370, partial [marine sediment metagenome]
MKWGAGCQGGEIVWIPMDQIRLHRVDPILVPDPVERKVYKGRDRLVRRMIRILPAADPVVSAKLVGSTPITVGFDI